MEKVNNVLKRYRKLRGISLEELAVRSGVAPEPYNLWDRVLGEWSPWDMSSLGEVDKVVFTMDCSEKNADGSLHIAPYFCIDGIRLK